MSSGITYIGNLGVELIKININVDGSLKRVSDFPLDYDVKN